MIEDNLSDLSELGMVTAAWPSDFILAVAIMAQDRPFDFILAAAFMAQDRAFRGHLQIQRSGN